MILPHHSLHLKDQIPENLKPADTIEILGRRILVPDRVNQSMRQLIDFTIRIMLIRSDPCQKIAPHFGSRLDQRAKILLLIQISVNEIAHRLTHRHCAMPVAELPVIIELEPIPHRMIPDRKSINHRVRVINMRTQEIIKPVFIDTLPVRCTVETSQASARKRELPKINDLALPRKSLPESLDHTQKRAIPIFFRIISYQRNPCVPRSQGSIDGAVPRSRSSSDTAAT